MAPARSGSQPAATPRHGTLRDSTPAWDPPSAPAADGIDDTTAHDSTSVEVDPTPRHQAGGVDWPFDSWRAAAEWWYRPVIEADSWVALGCLTAGVVLGPLLFAATIATLATTFGLVFALVGLLLVAPAFAVVNWLAGVERRRAEWVGETISPRPVRVGAGGLWSAISTRLGDPARWRQVSLLLLLVVAGPVFFVVGFLPWLFIIQLIAGPDSVGLSTGGFLAAGLLLGGAPRGTTFVANVAYSFTRWFLGPDPNAGLEERVAELSTQREQILDAVAGERRRIERNLHDGVQQQLVALGIDIGRAGSRIDHDPDAAKQLLADARDKVRGSIGELRLIGRGLHPAVLSDRGLDAALSAVVAGAPIPISVEIDAHAELSIEVAETAYYVVNEAVANVLKHAGARVASVHVVDEPGVLPAVRVTVHDDGNGGADPAHGSGLAGMRARVEGSDGFFGIESPSGGPTIVTAVIPIRRQRPEPARGTGWVNHRSSGRWWPTTPCSCATA